MNVHTDMSRRSTGTDDTGKEAARRISIR